MLRKPAFKFFAILFGFAVLAGEAEAEKVRVAMPDFSMSLIAFIVAKEKRFYQEEGLDVELIKMSAPVANLALIAGNVEFGAAGAAAIPSVMRGAPLQFLFHTYQRPLYWLYSLPDIQNLQALKGKRVGVSGIGSGPDLLLRDILRRYGVDAGRELTIMALGAGTARFMAMKAGSVEAAVLSPPSNFMAEEAGYRELLSFVNEDLVELQSAVVVREGMPQSNPALIEKFVRGTLKGFFYSRDNRAGTINILAKVQGGKPDLAVKTYDASRPAMTPDGTVSPELQRQTLELAAKRLDLKEVPPLRKVFDYSTAQKVRAQLTAQGWKPKD
jgi:ABC-type nitrate/sulfonate/bicarbonate transport system substrate-binding protein